MKKSKLCLAAKSSSRQKCLAGRFRRGRPSSQWVAARLTGLLLFRHLGISDPKTWGFVNMNSKLSVCSDLIIGLSVCIGFAGDHMCKRKLILSENKF